MILKSNRYRLKHRVGKIDKFYKIGNEIKRKNGVIRQKKDDGRVCSIDKFNNLGSSIPEIEFTDQFTDRPSTLKQILNANSFRANGLNVLPANWSWFTEYTQVERSTELLPDITACDAMLLSSDQDSKQFYVNIIGKQIIIEP